MLLKTRYYESENNFLKAKEVIPLGAQTYSKSVTQYPFGGFPLFAEKAKGCVLTDVDGNSYIDFAMGLCAFTLGYNNKEVNRAVKKQLKKGSVFSLSTTLEREVAELIIELCPNVDKVRFGKNGSDVTMAAVRVARAYTGKQRVATFGYHGIADVFIGATTRNWGIPEEISQYTHSFSNFEEFRILTETHDFACVVVEPFNVEYAFIEEVRCIRELCSQKNIPFILDEVITGFRVAPGGAQELCNIDADMICYGKGIANGFPLSVLAGKAEYMNLLDPDFNEDGKNVMFSATFGGDCISLTAAKAVLTKLKREKYTEQIYFVGEYLYATMMEEIYRSGICKHGVNITGNPTWLHMRFENVAMKTYYLQELAANGILSNGSFNMCLAHKMKHVDKLIEVSGKIFERIVNGKWREELKCEPISPAFRVR